ncbi:PD40 domain-containing protein [bacterium]|nr:PD40 domain-containing protein [bacterium]
MKNSTLYTAAAFVLSFVSLNAQIHEKDFHACSGPYLGQPLPADSAAIFAPGLISTGVYERDLIVSPDGEEIFFGIFMNQIVTILSSRKVNGRWTEPAVLPFALDFEYGYFEPALTADGNRLFCCSTQPPPGEEPLPGYGHQNIWTAERTADRSWGELSCLGEHVNQPGFSTFFPSVTRDGSLYFTARDRRTGIMRIYKSLFSGGGYQQAAPLPETVNGAGTIYNAFIDPDERYLLACITDRDDSITPGRANYYIFFRDDRGRWSRPVNLGERVNFPGSGAIAQSVSPDGRYLFFASQQLDLRKDQPVSQEWLLKLHNAVRNGNSDIYWISADFLHELKTAADRE